jgi:hypothetical protein
MRVSGRLASTEKRWIPERPSLPTRLMALARAVWGPLASSRDKRRNHFPFASAVVSPTSTSSTETFTVLSGSSTVPLKLGASRVTTS